MNKRITLWIMSFFAVLPSVFAIDMPFSMPSFIEFFRKIAEWLQNDYVVYFFTYVFFFVLLYGIYGAALGRINIFKGSSGGINKFGKMVAVSMGFLSTFAIFWFTREKGIQQVLVDVLSPFGVLAGLLIAIITFLIIYKGFESESGEKSWKVGLAAAGLGMIVAGMILSHPGIMWWGWLIGLIGMVFMFIGLLAGKGGEGGGGAGGGAGGGKGGAGGGAGGKEPKPDKDKKAGIGDDGYRDVIIDVRDVDDNPVPGATVKITPKGGRKWYKFGRRASGSSVTEVTAAAGENKGKTPQISLPVGDSYMKVTHKNLKILPRAAIIAALGATGYSAAVVGGLVTSLNSFAGWGGWAAGTIPFFWYTQRGLPQKKSYIRVEPGEDVAVLTVRLGRRLNVKELELTANPPSLPADNNTYSTIKAKLLITKTSVIKNKAYTEERKKVPPKWIGKLVEIETSLGEFMPHPGFEYRIGGAKGRNAVNEFGTRVSRGVLGRGIEGGIDPATPHIVRGVIDSNGDLFVRLKSKVPGKAKLIAKCEGITLDGLEVKFTKSAHLEIDCAPEVNTGGKLDVKVNVIGGKINDQ